MKVLSLNFLFIILFSYVSYGQLSVDAGVQYLRSDNTYSQYVFRDIILITGSELNKSTKTQNYERNSDYALIWFSNNEVAIIEFKKNIRTSTGIMLNDSITRATLQMYHTFNGYIKEGVDQNGRDWRICFHTSPFRSFCESVNFR